MTNIKKKKIYGIVTKNTYIPTNIYNVYTAKTGPRQAPRENQGRNTNWLRHTPD